MRELSMSTTLAERLLLSRRDLDITQTELAKRAGNVSAAYISDLERSKVDNPTVDVINSLADALGVRPEYLIGWDDDPTGEDRPTSIAEGRLVYQVRGPEEYRLAQQLLDLFNDMPPEDQKVLMEVAQRIARAGDVRIIGDQ